MLTRGGVDFLVLCPLDLEFEAVTSALSKVARLVDDTVAGLCKYEIALTDTRVAGVHVRLLRRQGNMFSGIATTDWLSVVAECKFVISFGIAGTIARDELQIGDVFIPRQVIYYELSREQEGPFGLRPESFRCQLPEQVLTEIRRQFANDDFTLGVVGDLASGEKLVDKPHSELVAQLRQISQRLIAVEMEAGGVAAATAHVAPSAHFFAVKGISDNADGSKKDGPAGEQSKNRKRSARNAARVLAAIISEIVRRDFELASSRSIYPLSRSAADAAVKQYEWLDQTIKRISVIDNTVDHVELAKSHVFATKHHPPVYYHWRQESECIHLVDFIYCSVLAHLRIHGYPVHMLVTDGSGMTGGDRQATRAMAKDWFGGQISFFSEAMTRDQLSSEAHASRTSIVSQYSDHIDEVIETHRYSKPANVFTTLRFWLNYVPFTSRQRYDSPSAILLCWDRHVPIYKAVVQCHLDFYPAVLNTPDIALKGNRGEPLKFADGTKDLVVGLSSTAKFAACIGAMREPALQSLLELLTEVSGLQVGERLSQVLGGLCEQVKMEIARNGGKDT